MCLDLTSATIKKQGTRKVYKLYTTLNQILDLEEGFEVKSFFRRDTLKIRAGIEIISNRLDKKLTHYENLYEEVNQGIHVYTKKQSAVLSMRKYPSSCAVLIECDAKASDFVAEGKFGVHQLPSAVYMKVIPRRIIVSSLRSLAHQRINSAR